MEQDVETEPLQPIIDFLQRAARFLLINAYDGPFIGQLSIGPDPLPQVMPEVSSDLKQ